MKKLFSLLLVLFLIVSCSEDVTNTNPNGNRYIAFSVTNEDIGQPQYAPTRSLGVSFMGDVKMVEVDTDFPSEETLYLTITDEPFIRRTNTGETRGALLNSDGAASLSFGVTEYPTGETDFANVKWVNDKPTYKENISAGVELFKASQTWEYDAYDGYLYDFYAYAPWVDNGVDATRGITLSDNYQSITYNATDIAVGSQPDLMTATKVTSSYVGAVPLTFHHRLCAIQIKTGGTWVTGYHVTSVQFQNVIPSGTFDIKNEVWGNYGTKGTYNVTGFAQADNINTIIAGDDNTWLMMVPQTLDRASFRMTLTDNDSHSYTITAPINNSEWKAGHTITYKISPESITSMTVNYPSDSRRWSGNTDGPVTSYTSGEQFGLFIVDKNNKIILSNGLVTASSAGASPTLTLPAGLFYSKLYKYFLMYPYRSDLSTIVGTYATTYALNCTNTATTAEAFFSDVITGWSVQADQSSIANFKGSDLQVAILSGNEFLMSHQMGLAGITLNSATVYDNYTYTYTSTTNQGTPTCTGENTWYASNTVNSSNIPYRASNTMAYIVKKPGVDAYTISATQSNVFSTYKETKRYAWSTTVPVIAAKNNYVSSTVSYAGPPYLQATWNIPFLNGIVNYTTPYAGKYEFKCWGASGGNGYSTYFFDSSQNTWRMASSVEQSNGSCYSYGGKGGYTYGILSSLAKNVNFFVCVGGVGASTRTARTNNTPSTPLVRAIAGGYNGGGQGLELEKKSNEFCHYGGGGGGATHIATATGLLSTLANTQVLMVAGAGGGGGGHTQRTTGGAGGNTTGGTPVPIPNNGHETAQGGTQIAGGRWLVNGTNTPYTPTGHANPGEWGKGGDKIVVAEDGVGGGGGGGAGYYGGAAGEWSAGAGGSSYINGHPGCTQRNATYVFSSTSMVNGTNVASQVPNPGTNNGYARIAYTYIP